MKKKWFAELIWQGFLGLIVTVESADLLYLYLAGGWTDPNRIILYTELTCLVILALVGILNLVRVFKVLKYLLAQQKIVEGKK